MGKRNGFSSGLGHFKKWLVKPLAVCFLALAAPLASALPTFEQTRRDFRPSDAVLLDRHGQTLHRLRLDTRVRRGQWVALADVSPALRAAMVLSEDKRFYEHSGVDWTAASAAAWGNLWNTRTRGASTISMQLAGLLDEDLQRGATGRNLAQKVQQTVSAQVLDRRWRKDEILEAYLNTVPFRGELVGIDALARTLFSKAPQGLDAREAAVAAALVRAPNAKASVVTQRACGVLKLMALNASDCEGLDVFVTGALDARGFAASQGIAPHLAQRLLRQPLDQGAIKTHQPTDPIRTSLSAPLQRFTTLTLKHHLRELRGRNVDDGAVVVLDNATGQVLAWVGSSGDLSQAADVDGVLALRQPGSTLKPFLYAQAIAQQRLTAASLLEDSPTQISTASGLYIPQNYDRQFKGWVSVRSALASSLNVPAVRALVMVSPDAFARQLRNLGLPLKETGDFYGYSLALGSAEVSLLTLTNAYRALGNGGRFSEAVLTPTTSSTTTALDSRAAFIVGDILSDPNARARTFGTDSVLATRFWTAVKTGTSKDMRDNWAVGYSQRYTVGVWVGNASGAAMHDVSGTSGAAPIWAALMNHLHAQEPSRGPQPPAGLKQVQTRIEGPDGTTTEAARSEWFYPGTDQNLFAIISIASPANRIRGDGLKQSEPVTPGTVSTTSSIWIASPTTGTVVALDPDIPPQRQRLTFVAQGSASATLRWQIDGKEVGRGSTAQWLPWPGRHRLQLLGDAGQVLDEVRLEVRGAGVRVPATPR
jgi:penicillin-binding protein 1C